jgi:membrane complex biogenesis BtpA family protein
MRAIYDHALKEAAILAEHDVDGLIIENFRDKPFYPGRAPSETVAALTAVAHEIRRQYACPLGINLLRNDGEAALAIATAVEASFIRVNVHVGAVVSDQGVIQGVGHLTMRLRTALRSNVMVFADVAVKHSAPLAERGIRAETIDAVERGLADAVIVSGEMTGAETPLELVQKARAATDAPVLIGSGATPENISKVFDLVDGFIVGSYFKEAGMADNLVDRVRVSTFMNAMKTLRAGRSG